MNEQGHKQKNKMRPRLIAKNITLHAVLKGYIKPGVFLNRLRDRKEEEENPSALPQYILNQIATRRLPPAYKGSKGRGACEFHLGTRSLWNFNHSMYMAWHRLNRRKDGGVPVEFHVSQKGTKALPPDEVALRKFLEENLHLWPPVVGKAMPEFSGTIIDPQTNFIQICWVIGPAVKSEDGYKSPANITDSFYKQQKRLKNVPLKRTKLEKKIAKHAKEPATSASEVTCG